VSAAPEAPRRPYRETKERLHEQAEALRQLAMEKTLERFQGRNAPSKRRAAQKEADLLERRVARLLRAATQLEAAVEREERRLSRLGKSKDPRDNLRVVLTAIDELPIDLALEACAEATKRTKARIGGEV